MSSLLHQFIVRTIREERELEPRAFERPAIQDLGPIDFNPAEAVKTEGDPRTILSQWYESEGREMPKDYGVIMFQGWDSFTEEERIDALKDAKKLLDKALKGKRKKT